MSSPSGSLESPAIAAVTENHEPQGDRGDYWHTDPMFKGVLGDQDIELRYLVGIDRRARLAV